MLKQGFKEDIEKIFKKVSDQASKKPQTLLFSATIPPWLENISRSYQTDCHLIDRVRGSNITIPKTIKHFKYFIKGPEEITQAIKKICNQIVSP